MYEHESTGGADNSVEAVITRLFSRVEIEAGIDTAVFHRFVDRLRHDWLRQQPGDSACESCVCEADSGGFASIISIRPWPILAAITLLKLCRTARRFGRESYLVQELIDNAASPEALPILREEINAVLRALPHWCGEVLLLMLRGMEVTDVRDMADKLGCSRWTLRRALSPISERLMQRAREVLEDDGPDSASAVAAIP